MEQAYYGYDFRGQRVWRQLHTPGYLEIHYVYDQDGRLLAEHNGDTGAVLKQYVWLDDTPLAVIDRSSGSDVIYYVHTGQLEEPQVMTNASTARVWDAYIEPFGRAQALGTISATLYLRFPRQWEQLESGGFTVHDIPDLRRRMSGERPWAFQFRDFLSNDYGYYLGEHVVPRGLPNEQLKRSCMQLCAKK